MSKAWYGLPLLMIIAVARTAFCDDFERLEGATLAAIPGSNAVEPREGLSFSAIGSLPRVLGDVRSALLLVQTEDGNLAPVTVEPALRKSKTPGAEPRPVIMLTRFATFEGPSASNRLASGDNVVLFDGFEFDLETGQVVPAGQGGDLVFHAKAEAEPTLQAVGTAKLWSFSKPPLVEQPPAGQLSPGKLVVPADFNGRYRLSANGQWSGLLEIGVGERNVVTGRFRSDQTGNSYSLTGQAAYEEPHRILFAIELPRSRLEFDGRLWTDGKQALAGVVNLLGRDYGFYATRETTAEVAAEPKRAP